MMIVQDTKVSDTNSTVIWIISVPVSVADIEFDVRRIEAMRPRIAFELRAVLDDRPRPLTPLIAPPPPAAWPTSIVAYLGRRGRSRRRLRRPLELRT